MIERKEIQDLALSVALTLTENEEKIIQKDLSDFLSYFKILDGISLVDMQDKENKPLLRDDTAIPNGLNPEEFLDNLQYRQPYFTIPKLFK